MAKYTVIGKTKCGQCSSAKQLFDLHNIDYEYKVLDDDISLTEVREIIPANVSTVPILLEDGEYIGGTREIQSIVAGA